MEISFLQSQKENEFINCSVCMHHVRLIGNRISCAVCINLQFMILLERRPFIVFCCPLRLKMSRFACRGYLSWRRLHSSMLLWQVTSMQGSIITLRSSSNLCTVARRLQASTHARNDKDRANRWQGSSPEIFLRSACAHVRLVYSPLWIF